MPRTKVLFYRDQDGTVPLLDWTDTLEAKVQDKCRAAIERLRDHGHELRRPVADYLRDSIYELRVRRRGTNYRMLYFFHRRQAVVLSHGLAKERVVPPKEIDRAIERKNKYEANPKRHTHEED